MDTRQHLPAPSPTGNTAQAMTTSWARHRESGQLCKLSADQARELRRLRSEEHVRLKILAARFRISIGHASAIARNLAYKSVVSPLASTLKERNVSMAIDITAIPADRLALLDTAVLYGGAHSGSGGPDCQHCARELLHEAVLSCQAPGR